MTPKGKLIIIGGAVDKGSFTESNFEDQVEKNLNFFEKGILRRIIDESKKGTDSRIEIIPTASKIPDVVGQEYARAFSFLGADNVGVLKIEKRETALAEETLERVNAADVIFFTG
ncbi:MAG: cyanophycinase, partial [Crocinitomicaceae bacterium]